MRFVHGVTVIGLLTLAASAAAQTAPAPSAEQSLAAIREQLQRIEAVLRAEIESRRADLLLRRAEVLNQELAPLEAELRGLRTAVDEQTENLRFQEAQMKAARDAVDALPPGASEGDVRVANLRIEQLTMIHEAAKRRIRSQTERAEELEALVARRREDRTALLAEVDRTLARSGRP